MLTSTILSETISRSVPKDDELLLLLAIAPSTASKYPDTQSRVTAIICISKYKNIEVDTPSNKANMVTLLGVNFNFKRNSAPNSIIGFTYFLACVSNILPPNFIYYSLSFC